MLSGSGIKTLAFSIVLTGGFLLFSCSYKYLGPEEPEVISSKSCPHETAEQAQSHAFSVILNAMNARNWHISSIDREDFEIDAKVKGAEWTRVQVKVKPGGVIRIERKLEANFSRSQYSFMEKSIEDVKKLYFKKYRCRSGRKNPR